MMPSSARGIDPEVERDRIQQLESLISEEGRFWLEAFAAGSLGFHELLDRVNLAGDFFEQHILNHPACLKNARWYQMASLAVSTLRDLYQTIGQDQIRMSRTQRIDITEDTLSVDLTDGRTIAVPLVWYPRLLQATPEERAKVIVAEDGMEISWPGVGENISIESLLIGRPSGESQESLERWLQNRQARDVFKKDAGDCESGAIPPETPDLEFVRPRTPWKSDPDLPLPREIER